MTKAKEEKKVPYIRRMIPKDVEEVYNMGKNTPEFAVSDTSSFWEKIELERWTRENLDDVLLVAEMNGKIVGFVLTKYHRATRVGGFIDLLVKDEYRRRGI